MSDDRERLIHEHSPESSSKNSAFEDDTLTVEIEGVDGVADKKRDEYSIEYDTEEEYSDSASEAGADDDGNDNDDVELGVTSGKGKRKSVNIQDNDDVIRVERRSSRRPSRAHRGPIDVRDVRKLNLKDQATKRRLDYYRGLDKFSNSNLLEVPSHVIPLSFYAVLPIEPGVKQSSIVTIFAIGNLMIGTSSLSMPWAIQQAGLLMGLFLILFMCALACYTVLVVVNLTFTYEANFNGGKPVDFSDVCQHYLGPVGKWAAVICSLLAIVGAMFAYWILMTNFLYNDISFIVDSISSGSVDHSDDYKECICTEHTNSSFYYSCFRDSQNSSGLTPFSTDSGESEIYKKVWDQTNTVPFFLILLVAPLINFKSPTFFTKFNSLGTVSVVYVMCFLIMKACFWGVNVTDLNYPFPDESNVPLFGAQFASLSGIAMLAFFSHNAAVTVLRNQKNPENNTRDVILGYMVGLCTYLCSGFVFYLSYPLNKSCIQQNLLDNFGSSDIFSFVGRIFLFFQMLAVFPLLAYVVRLQFYYSFFHNSDPSYVQIVSLNLIAICLCAVVAFIIPSIGTVTRFSGAISGAVYVSILPCLGIMQRQRMEGKLTKWSVLLNGSICVIGVANLIAQFFVKE
ncbi:neutral amino acid transporter 9-like isoform X2 [Symsagittifera roscoffensis]|uniref:neutral amino acid transporter 9-like isoform X2 n=1 Tax=Symsagittifera roscoffensis TaxID=84072 RepID=UPI00307CB4A6